MKHQSLKKLEEATNAQVVKYPCCGKVFSACIDGFQDAEFDREVRKYRSKGYISEIVPRGSFKFESCTCVKEPAKKDINPNQLSIAFN